MEKTTMAKTFKTKLVLGIMAATLTLALAIGGTLMLFTATSGPATNTVTLGSDIGIALQEYDVNDEWVRDITNDDYVAIGEAYKGNVEGHKQAFDGIDFGEIIPGGLVDKRPRVYNTGEYSVYVYVEGTFNVPDFTFTDSFVEQLNLLNANETDEEAAETILGNLSGDELQIARILGAVVLNSGWRGTAYDVEGGNLIGTYFWATNAQAENGDFYLADLETERYTADIFTGITIPTSVDDNFKGQGISLELTAYAVQAANNPNATFETVHGQFQTDNVE
jgi:hypothetical protein